MCWKLYVPWVWKGERKEGEWVTGREILMNIQLHVVPSHLLWRAVEMNNLLLFNFLTLHETLEVNYLLLIIIFFTYISIIDETREFWVLYKSTGQNLDDDVKVPPLCVDEHVSLSQIQSFSQTHHQHRQQFQSITKNKNKGRKQKIDCADTWKQ